MVEIEKQQLINALQNMRIFCQIVADQIFNDLDKYEFTNIQIQALELLKQTKDLY